MGTEDQEKAIANAERAVGQEPDNFQFRIELGWA